MLLEEILKQEQERFIKENLLSDEMIELLKENIMPFNTLMAYYRCAIMEVETKFKVLNEEFSLQYDRNPIESIKSRIKSMDGIFKKAKKKNIPITMEGIEEGIRDIAGVRVICSFPEDIYMLADCLLKQDDVVLVERKDYIKNPKPSGYRSLHLIIEIPIFLQNEKKMMKVEVQFRTIAIRFVIRRIFQILKQNSWLQNCLHVQIRLLQWITRWKRFAAELQKRRKEKLKIVRLSSLRR